MGGQPREVGYVLASHSVYGLDISAQTVPVHARNIYRKLEAKTKTEAVYLAHQRGLIDL